MKKIKSIIFLLVAIIFLRPAIGLAGAPYQEINTSLGKVIIGLDKEKAYQMFGAPASKGPGLWYYAGPAKFFVNFSEIPSILLYPDFCQATVGIPLEFKVFLSLPDLGIRDITKEVQLLFDQPECVRLKGPGVIIPKKKGEYSALAIYKNVFSNPFYIQVKELEENKQKEKEKKKERLLSIDVLPYRPKVLVGGSVDFVALGTFFDYDLHEYSVRNISQEADWSMCQRTNLTWNNKEGNRLFFPEQGQAEVLSKYKETESFLQHVDIKDKVDFGITGLKHISVLPETMVVPLNMYLNMRVFGTYYDNSVVELTQKVKWKIANPDILKPNKNGFFFAKSEGVTEVTAIKDGVQGLPIKVVVVSKSGHFVNARAIVNSGQKEEPERNTPEEIKENVEINSGQKEEPERNTPEEIKDSLEKLKEVLSVKKKELREIKIIPKSMEIGLGEKGKFSATGIYNDGSSSDLTILGSWGILNRGIATVSGGGNVTCVSLGQTSAYVDFKGVRSEYSTVVVTGPRLVSLLLTPQSLRIPIDGKAKFKVQGNYYDYSQRDLTGQVSWGIEGPAAARIENGVVRPLKFGKSKIYAQYLRIKSNAASIDVILTLGWLLWLLAKIILVLLSVILCLFLILYVLAQKKRRQLRALKNKPREFILGLYENATRLITIFGLHYDVYTFPLCYAELVKQKFLAKNNVFLNFSIKFEEAKYSQHVLLDSDVAAAVNDYNIFFEGLCKNQSRMLSFYRYCLALVHCRPIFIFYLPI